MQTPIMHKMMVEFNYADEDNHDTKSQKFYTPRYVTSQRKNVEECKRTSNERREEPNLACKRELAFLSEQRSVQEMPPERRKKKMRLNLVRGENGPYFELQSQDHTHLHSHFDISFPNDVKKFLE